MVKGGVYMIDIIVSTCKDIITWVLQLLPLSPFQTVIDGLANMPNLGWLNWFVPVDDIIKVGELWLIAISLYYIYSVILRWTNVIY